MGRPRGLEPPTPGTTNQCSNQLSYDRHGAFGSGSLARAGHLGLRLRERKQGKGEMNPTIEKFGYPATLVHELRHWLVLLRPAQVTLGSLVLAAKSNATAYSALPAEAFTEQAVAIGMIERALTAFTRYERINYLMLMMVDPNVHFHVIPRYSGSRQWNGVEFVDAGWPGPPLLGDSFRLSAEQIGALVNEISETFR
jgi:diadenosine tetraphosphate (Ap4A) HIT family hydrolase